jgi:hypothetical protein
MEMKRQLPFSHLFTVRLWQEELGNGQTELCSMLPVVKCVTFEIGRH